MTFLQFLTTFKKSFGLILLTALCFLQNSCGNKTAQEVNTASPNSGKDNTAGNAPINTYTSSGIPAKLPEAAGKYPVQFAAPDGLTIYATLYHQERSLPIVVLCHQAGSSKDEYAQIAPRLNKLGFNCLSIDQRSGGKKLGGQNQTADLALQKGLLNNYIDAEQDIIAAIEYAFAMYDKPIILVGSSYSASLSIKIGSKNPKVWAVSAFSPGEYFANDIQLITNSAHSFTKPLFITSSKEESADTKKIFDASPSKQKTQFVPSGEGIHGSRALWKETPNSAEYWQAFEAFLKGVQ